jgi:hypothetical protein
VIRSEEAAIARCQERLAEIDDELAQLDRVRDALVAEQTKLALVVEAARDPSVLNRRRR